MELRSATGHQVTTTANTTICLRTGDGVNVAGDFQIAPKNTGLLRSVISVGQVCDRGNIKQHRWRDILNEFTGNRQEFGRSSGVYRLRADTRAKTKSETGGVKSVDGVVSKTLRMPLKGNPQDLDARFMDVKHKACTHTPTEIVFEESPVGEREANGSIERTNQPLQGQIREIKDYTERQIGATIGLDSSVFKWLVRHAAWTLTTFHVGSDGMTAHQRIRGKPVNQQIAAFGEQILFKPHKTTGPQQKLVVNLLDGCGLGFNTTTGEHIVSNNAAVVTCRCTPFTGAATREIVREIMRARGSTRSSIDLGKF